VKREEFRAGVIAVTPLLVGVIPFGLVAGAAPVDAGLGGGIAVGLSTVVFAGASQLAMVDVLGGGGSVAVAVLTAWTINLRLMLYSASLSPFLARESHTRRAGIAYVLTDQAYAVSITRWAGGGHGAEPERRVPFYLGAALALWVNWQVCTVVGVLLGAAIPDALPIEFAVPLVFLVLLVPTLTSSPAVMAALFGGAAAVLCAQYGDAHLATVAGAAAGITAGVIAEYRRDGPATSTPVVEPPAEDGHPDHPGGDAP